MIRLGSSSPSPPVPKSWFGNCGPKNMSGLTRASQKPLSEPGCHRNRNCHIWPRVNSQTRLWTHWRTRLICDQRITCVLWCLWSSLWFVYFLCYGPFKGGTTKTDYCSPPRALCCSHRSPASNAVASWTHSPSSLIGDVDQLHDGSPLAAIRGSQKSCTNASRWRYVDLMNKPADDISRGKNLANLAVPH